MKKVLVLFLALVSLAPISFAQPKSGGDSLDQATDELMTILQMEKNTNDLIRRAIDARIAQEPRAAGAREQMIALLTKYIGWEAIRDDIKNIYKGQFTEPEMRELISFYKSPIGQKYLRVMPSILDQGSIVIQQRKTPHQAELEYIINEEVKRATAAQPAPPRAK